MREIGNVEAQNKFGELIDQVEHGEEIIITRAARPLPDSAPPKPASTGRRAGGRSRVFWR